MWGSGAAEIARETLDIHGAVSEAVAAEMAFGALRNSAAQLAVAITGIAGPGGSDHKPEGRVCFGLATRGEPASTETVEFGPRGRDATKSSPIARSASAIFCRTKGAP